MRFGRWHISDELHVFLLTTGVLLFQVSAFTVLLVLAYNYHWRMTPWISFPIGIIWMILLKLNMEASVTLGSEWLKNYHQGRKQQKHEKLLSLGKTPEVIAEHFGNALKTARIYDAKHKRDTQWEKYHWEVATLLDEFVKSLAKYKPPGEWASEVERLMRENGLPPWIHDGGEYLDFVRNPSASGDR